MFKFTKPQLKLYLAGKLKLVTGRGTHITRFVPAGKNPLDKGVTKPTKRAYYRLWYLKNRKKRAAYREARKLRLRHGLHSQDKAANTWVKAEVAKHKKTCGTCRCDEVRTTGYVPCHTAQAPAELPARTPSLLHRIIDRVFGDW